MCTTTLKKNENNFTKTMSILQLHCKSGANKPCQQDLYQFPRLPKKACKTDQEVRAVWIKLKNSKQLDESYCEVHLTRDCSQNTEIQKSGILY